MSVEIFLGRHGQSKDNIAGVMGGHRDAKLTDLGRQQAHNLGLGIIDTGLTFDAVYCSPLVRAHETADIVAEVAGLPKPIVINDLIERNAGVLEGMKFDDIRRNVKMHVIIAEHIHYFLDPEGAETFPELVVRGQKVLDQVNKLHTSGRVLLICHGDIGKMIYAASTGQNWETVLTSFHLGNAELIDLGKHHDAHVIKLEQFNH
ncbi:histidine phosphatase family protein [Patescibacteria group bacterium]|nr:MAG: histidine phosphatase family protein [Patescibacteria group bacterium]